MNYMTRLGWKLEPARAYHFDHNGDRYGWVKGSNGKWHFTLFIQSGRIKDLEDYPANDWITRNCKNSYR